MGAGLAGGWYRVIGVVKDIAKSSTFEPVDPAVVLPARWQPVVCKRKVQCRHA